MYQHFQHWFDFVHQMVVSVTAWLLWGHWYLTRMQRSHSRYAERAWIGVVILPMVVHDENFHLCLRLFGFGMPIPTVTGECISNFDKFASIISLITTLHRCPTLYNLHMFIVTRQYIQNYRMSWSSKKHVISEVQNAMVFQLLSMSVWRHPVATH